ncbi:MAG: aldehyde dehydrogenase family protein, partial [Planctomycetota bacterium]
TAWGEDQLSPDWPGRPRAPANRRRTVAEAVQQHASELRDRLVERTMGLISGDPKNVETFIGPMISEREAARVQSWIQQAQTSGANLLCGGDRNGAVLEATLLENVPKDEKVVAREAFGPVAVLSRFSNFSEALHEVNDSDFGLQTGVFTRDLYKMQQAWDTLEVGGVIIGDVPSWRVDHMPYGGVKDSGLGREGIRFSMEDMTEIRNLVIRTPAA